MRYLIILILTANTLAAQVSFKRSLDWFTVSYLDSATKIQHSLSFNKASDSDFYKSLRYSSYNYISKVKTDEFLCEHISTILMLWEKAADSIKIDLTNVIFDYPLKYADIAKKQVEVFLKSAKWQAHIKTNGKKIDTKLMREIMITEKVYGCIYDMLAKKGYMLVKMETEKHGFITKQDLIKLGYKGNEIIPMPFMVYQTVTNK
jgi:hypothetical protein